MTRLLIDALLGLSVLAAILGTLGFLRLRDTLDRLHCVAFVNVAVGVPLCLAAFLSDGVSDRPLKMVLITAAALSGGAATAHAVGRAMVARGDVPEALEPAGLPRPNDPPRADQTLG